LGAFSRHHFSGTIGMFGFDSDRLLVAGFSFLAREEQREGAGFEEMQC